MMKKLFLLSALLLTFVGFSQTITLDSAPTEATPEQTGLSVTFSYSGLLNGADKYEVQLLQINNAPIAGGMTSSDIDFDSGGLVNSTSFPGGTATPATLDSGAATSGTQTFTFDLPAIGASGMNGSNTLQLSSDTVGWAAVIKIIGANSDGTDAWADGFSFQVIDIVETLGTNDFSRVDSAEMFFKNSSSSLVINTDLITSKSALIFDITGKNVAAINNLKETPSLDLSSLDNGMYILRTDDHKSIKFVR